MVFVIHNKLIFIHLILVKKICLDDMEVNAVLTLIKQTLIFRIVDTVSSYRQVCGHVDKS